MKIRMTTSMVGTGFTLNNGEETERFGEAEARRIIAAGFAVPVVEEKIERAVPVRAAKETRRKKG